eukprot:1790078-Rhodomonas_salina.7
MGVCRPAGKRGTCRGWPRPSQLASPAPMDCHTPCHHRHLLLGNASGASRSTKTKDQRGWVRDLRARHACWPVSCSKSCSGSLLESISTCTERRYT